MSTGTELGGLIILMGLGSLVCFAGQIWFLVKAFQRGVGWGLLVFFLSPFTSLIFLVKYWNEAHKPFLLSLVGCLLVVVPLGRMIAKAGSLANAAMVLQAQESHSPGSPDIFATEQEIQTSQRRVADMLQGAGIDPENTRTFRGRTIAEITEVLGKPSATMKLGAEETYIFHDCFEVVSRDHGRTVDAVHYMGK